MGNEVECTACGLRLQVRGKGKFEIERHWEQKHKDRWHFVTMGSNLDSIVIRRLKEEEPAFPFFS